MIRTCAALLMSLGFLLAPSHAEAGLAQRYPIPYTPSVVRDSLPGTYCIQHF